MRKFDNTDRGNQKRQNTEYKTQFKRKQKPRDWSVPSNLDPYERSVWFLNTFNGGMVELRAGESSDSLIKRFKRVVENSGMMRELKKREFYLSKGQKRREKKKRALKKLRKRIRAEEFFDMKEERRDSAYKSDAPPRNENTSSVH